MNVKLESLREEMKKHTIHGYLIPSTDAHQSEYVPGIWKRRAWLSGFTGSAGDLAVTLEQAGLWTDSRYFLQAEKELQDSGFTLYKDGLPDTVSMADWLKQNLKSGDKVGIDPRLFTKGNYETLQKALTEKEIQLKFIETNFVDQIWEDQPDFPLDPIQPRTIEYAGKSIEEKIKAVQTKITEKGAGIHLVNMLDSIAWLFNIRSKDVLYTPVTIAYGIITTQKAYLFVKKEKTNDELKEHLSDSVILLDYEDFKSTAVKLINECSNKILLDPNSASLWMIDFVADKSRIIWDNSPIDIMKSVKNSTEIEGFKNCHIRDGAAMVKFLNWLDKNVGHVKVTECSAAERLRQFRAEQDLFQDMSFETISSYKEHGAVIHYSPSKETDVDINREGIYLIDSGGQYLDGTTDITRTISFDQNPDDWEKECFTRVLKGHLALWTTSFPRGTAGRQLDTIARLPLWEIGLNYLHGTGHGIGSYLGVHEGPQAISYYRCKGISMELGMVNSNEPGYYEPGKFGMRIENLIYVVKDEKKSNKDMEFYKFENLTLCPVEQKLIKKELLTKKEIDFLNQYHQEIYDKISPLVNDEEKEWLKQATRPIE